MITGPVWPGMVPVCDHFLSILTSLVSVLGRAPDWTLNQSWFSCSVMSDSCDPMNCSPPGSSVHGISQARILEGVAMSFSRVSSQPRDQIWVSCIAGGFFLPIDLPWVYFFLAFIAFKIWVNLLAHHCITVLEYSEFDCVLTFTKKGLPWWLSW